MTKVIRNTANSLAGIVAALVLGAPAIADDTELLLLLPNQAQAPKPNILFIIDTSGSMDTEENSRLIYRSTRDYSDFGDCSNDSLYWSETGTIPSCDASNDKLFLKSSFVCEGANLQLGGIGRFTSVMAQYRDDGTAGMGDRWLPIEPGNTSDIVECRKDSGKHGDGTAGDVYARKGGDTSAFTDDPDLEVAWGNAPLTDTITVFDGNYLNYLANPEFADQERIDIVKDVAEAVLNSMENVNIGLMRFNDNQGGPVILGMTDLDSNRQAIIDKVKTLDAEGNTPLSETLYEAARYWRGLTAYYGENVDEHPTDPNALVNDDPEEYLQPNTPSCAKNFNVILTDGEPVDDDETPTIVGSLPDWASIDGTAGCVGTEDGRCLDDIAAYLFDKDISTDAGKQNVSTHTIGFSVDLDILEDAARVSEGSYFQADDVSSLTIALLEIFRQVQEQSLSFAAPAVAVNTFNRTQNLNDLFLTTFAASETVRWPGNLKKYRISGGQVVDEEGIPAIDPDSGLFDNNASSFWSSTEDGGEVSLGGALEQMPLPDDRNLYTNNTGNNLTVDSNKLLPANANNFTNADFGLTGSANEPTREQLIRWARGEDVRDEDDDTDTTTRKFMGDPLHSQPAAIVYGGDEDNPEMVVYTATNDGYVHAIDAATGQELWAFIPKELLPNLVKLYFDQDSQFKNYGVDGNIVPVVKDLDGDGIIESGDDFVYLIFGMRRGGNSYYALDVTNKNSPKLKWTATLPAGGQSWSTPTVARMNIAGNVLGPDQAVVVVGGGYDSVHDSIAHPANPDTNGAGIYFLDLESGNMVWRAGSDDPAELTLDKSGRAMTRSFPNQIRVVDLNADGFADRMYASDVGGQIWRFDIFGGKQADGTGDDALVTGGVIAQLGAEGNGNVSFGDTRRFYNAPDVSIFDDFSQSRQFLAVSIGSGYRAHPLDDRNDDRFFSIRDRDVFNKLSQDDYDSYDIVKDNDLVEVSGQVGTIIGQNDRGWKFTLPDDQKVLANSVTFNNEVFFVGFAPDIASAANCEAGNGKNFLYRVSIKNGDPIGDLSAILPNQEDAARVTDLQQGGIAPGVRFLFPGPDGTNCAEGEVCSPPPIACVGVECFDPGFANLPVRTIWTQDGIE